MQSIGPSVSAASVFTAGFPGIHTFAVVAAGGLMGAQFDVNGDAVNNAVAVQGSATTQITFSVYLASGDVLSYQGPAADLAGVRLGDEL